MTIYDVVKDFHTIENLINEIQVDDETGEVREFTEDEKETFISWIKENQEDLNKKFDGIYKVWRNFRAEAEIAEAERQALKDEMDRLSKRAKARENEASRVKELFTFAMASLGMKKFKSPLFSIGYQATRKCARPILGFFKPDDIPVEFLKRELSVSAVNEAIESGQLYEKEGFENYGKLFYKNDEGEQELKGVAYTGGESLVIR